MELKCAFHALVLSPDPPAIYVRGGAECTACQIESSTTRSVYAYVGLGVILVSSRGPSGVWKWKSPAVQRTLDAYEPSRHMVVEIADSLVCGLHCACNVIGPRLTGSWHRQRCAVCCQTLLLSPLIKWRLNLNLNRDDKHSH